MKRLLALAALIFATPALSATYYVDCAASNDKGAGTSPETAWQTIDRVNRSSFKPGDSILFKRGCTWREQLTVSSSGTSGKPITFAVYGSGAAPIINAADLVSSWTDNGGNTWRATVTIEPTLVVFNGTRGTRVASVEACNGDKKWYWALKTLYAYGTEGLEVAYPDQIEAPARDCAIKIQNQDYVTVQDIDTRNANRFLVLVQNSNYVTINGGLHTQAGYAGAQINNWVAGGESSRHITFRNMEVSRAGGNGITVPGDAGTVGYVTIQNNKVHDNGWDSGTGAGYNPWNAGIKIWGGANLGFPGESDNALIEGNVVYNQADNHGDYSGTGIWVDQWGENAVVRYNYVHDNAAYGILVENCLATAAVPPQVYYNIVHSNNKGISINRDVTGALVYNNTVYANTRGGLICEGVGIQTTMVKNIFKNNISTGNGTNLVAILGGENAGGGSGNIYEYNCLGTEAAGFVLWGNGEYKSTCEAWETAYGGLTHSVESDPDFTDASRGDFTLLATSPCIDAGADVGPSSSIALMPGSSWPNNVLTGDQRKTGLWWEIGAYLFPEGRPPAPPPTPTPTPTPPPVGLAASFTFSPEAPAQGEQVQFTDASTGASTWDWNFGDGTRSLGRNPVHTYAERGTYTAVLWVGNGVNYSQAVKTVTIGTPVRKHLPKR